MADLVENVGIRPMFTKSYSLLLTLLVGVTLGFITWQSIAAKVPEITAPMPIWIIGLRWWIPYPAIILWLPSITMWLWNPSAFRGETMIPTRSWGLYFLLGILSLLFYISFFSYGNQFQGRTHTLSLAIINFFFCSIILLVGLRSRRKPSFTANLLFHWLLFAWVSSYAFPFFGESP